MVVMGKVASQHLPFPCWHFTVKGKSHLTPLPLNMSFGVGLE